MLEVGQVSAGLGLKAFLVSVGVGAACGPGKYGVGGYMC